jgi:predicted transcriptional regulator
MEYQIIQDRVTKLASFTSALEDGVVSKQELDGQEQRLMAAMKQVEGQLNDDQHEKVTALLVEMSAYNVMRLLHELQSERARLAFGKA